MTNRIEINDIVKGWEITKKITGGKHLCTCIKCKDTNIFWTKSLREKTCRECKCVENARGKWRGKDTVGKRFWDWTIVELLGYGECIAECACGKTTKKMLIRDITSGASKSCGHKYDINVGAIFGEWTVIEYISKTHCLAMCTCGEKKTLNTHHLKRGTPKNCGHTSDLSGKWFGEWYVIRKISTTKCLARCSCGKIKEVYTQSLKNGRTKSCGHSKIVGKIFGSLKVIGTKREDGYTLYRCECECGIIKDMHLTNIIKAESCGCKSESSKYEKIISEKFPGAQRNLFILKDGASKYQVDLMYKDKQIAIEFNGDYWHSSKFKSPDYHWNKTKLAEKQGIKLIHIFEHEWINNEERLTNLIKRTIYNEINIEGIECTTEYLKEYKAREFINKYNIYGNIESDIHLGLIYRDEIVAAVAIKNHMEKGCYEIDRITFGNYNVTGGIYKILLKFIEDYNPEKIIAYCDRSKFTGETYRNLDFSLEAHDIEYTWVKNHTEYNDMDLIEELDRGSKDDTMDLIEEELDRGNKDDTMDLIEEELDRGNKDDTIKNKGYLKIYKCGYDKYVWINNKYKGEDKKKKSRSIEYIGHITRGWKVKERDKTKRNGYKYICTCIKCGRERSFWTKAIKGDKCAECKCDDTKECIIDYKQGDKIGEWEVIKKSNNGYYTCKCGCCNEIKDVSGTNLRNGRSKSCGKQLKNEINRMVGSQFGEWTVKEYIGKEKFLCECSCGEIKEVYGQGLKKGTSKSCGHAVQQKVDELIGQTFGEWTIIGKNKKRGKYDCVCSCGEERPVIITQLRNGQSKSCGHSIKEGIEELIGKKFSKLTVESHVGNGYFICKCECGGERIVYKYKLINELTRSCGCMSNKSRYEDEIDKLFSGAERGKYVLNINNKKHQIDLLYRDKCLGIEFNGDYWHSEKIVDEHYHLRKTESANGMGIKLIHIFEHEWLSNKDRIIKYLKSQLGELTKITTEECELIELKSEDIKEFENTYNIEGYTNADIVIALKYKNEITMSMTFGESKLSQDYQYEVYRLTLGEYEVTDGAEKMFREFISKYNANSIVAYCDKSKFTGDTYKKIGFSFESNNGPNYVWTRGGKALSKYETTKEELLKSGYGELGDTEIEIMNSRGYYRIYDCGNDKYVYKHKN